MLRSLRPEKQMFVFNVDSAIVMVENGHKHLDREDLVPLLWAHGSGGDVMRRHVAPMIGGLVVSFAMELVVYPVIFYTAKNWLHQKE